MQNATIILNEIEFKIIKPTAQLADFVESFWMLKNFSANDKEIIVLPDGRFDIIFSFAKHEAFHTALMGLSSEAEQTIFPAGVVMFAVSFKLPAIEYLLDIKAAALLNTAHNLPDDFWGITKNDLDDFEHFCTKVSAKMITLVKQNIDERKRQLFELIYASNGALSVKKLSAKTCWSQRQINRYFNQFFGISLKTYCNILRFRASFTHIKEGKLFPEQNFADQAHFIKNVKKFAGVIPKELSKNKEDRFIQFSTLPKK